MQTLIFSLCLSIATLVHVGHVAEYTYTRNAETFHLKFTIEKEELLGLPLDKNCDVKQLTALCTAKYLNQHSSLKINDQKISFSLLKSYTHQDHLIVEMTAPMTINTIKKISYSNTAFYTFNTNFKNRILLHLAPFKKSYLLTKKKHSIQLK